MEDGDWKVVVGEHTRADTSDGTIHEKCRYVNHPKFNQGSFMAYALAIVHLKEPVKFGPRAVMACLPTSKHRGDFLAGKTLTVSGWGIMGHGVDKCPDALHAAKVTGLSNKQCKKRHGKQIDSVKLCAGNIDDGGQDSCQGDSGGGLPYSKIKILKLKYLVAFV